MRLSEAVSYLSESGVFSARHDARELFVRIGGHSPSALLFSDPEASDLVKSAVERRAAGEPLQYIIGEVGFYRESYRVSPDCLIPRADTELLVDYAVKNIPEGKSFLDLCTGSGCIGISTLANTKGTRATLGDLSTGALALARENAERNGVIDRADFLNTDLLRAKVEGRYFALLSNPPYIADSVYERLDAEIFHEPRMAFVGGADGSDFYRAFVPTYKDSIEEGGFMAFEIGYDQAELLMTIAAENDLPCEILYDIENRARVAVLKISR